MTSTRGLPGGAAAIAAAALLFAAGACGKSSSTAPSPGLTCSTLPNATTILIVNNAVCPQRLTVTRGSQVTFINNDTRPHQMNSDPHPEHTNCTELNQVGHLEAGQQRQTGNLNIVRTCGFHDHLNDRIAAMSGSITTQ